MTNFEFANPLYLWLLILVPLLAVWMFWSYQKQKATITLAHTVTVKKDFYTFLYISVTVGKLLALVLLIVALARPRNVGVTVSSHSEFGIDIVMAMDVSGSMLSKDLKPNRLEALKEVAQNFVDKRIHDRIGLVLYAGESYAKLPITNDKPIIKNTIASINYGEIEDGTAIGMGLGTAVNRLKDSKAKSKVVILLTDGVNNAGTIDPKLAIELAKGTGIKVYTIGIGTNGMALSPYAKNAQGQLLYQRTKVEIDEKLLKNIANETGGSYFRATSKDQLQAIYNEIDQLEKTAIEAFKYYNYQELYPILVLVAMLLLVLEFVLKNTLLKSIV